MNTTGNETHYNSGSRRLTSLSETEKLIITSGKLLVIDQFMLSNEQFSSLLSASQQEVSVEEAVLRFGGLVVNIPNGNYLVFRDPYQMIIVVAPSDDGEPDFSQIIADHDALAEIGKVYVDTRCVVFLDLDTLRDETVLHEYSSLRRRGEDKQARDLIRKQGGAVRYGFSSVGDELIAHSSADNKILALWPLRNK